VSDEELVATVAHQVKTPLAVIRGYAELLGVRDDEATRHEAAAQIREAAEVLDVMLDDLLVLFALESEILPFEPHALDLAPVAAGAIARLADRFPRHAFSASLDDVAPVHADIEHVDRMFGTLLLNACRLSPRGGDVVVAGRNAGEVVAVSVSDTGAGLSDDELADAFERNRPSLAVERSELRSTGLELYKVRRLVQLHGGSVNAESRPGRGSTFSFTLPRARAGDGA
jgi:signal transduction histidine kinase